ncbi:unnamed protein product [Orchesella dallaii]|uniref:F-box domain-containing protein n=1 Tax=Orchesella dallaii TaxID=48710 RepID=A0ABP1RMD5_9HEXA
MDSSDGSGDFKFQMEERDHPLLNFVVLRVLFDHACFKEFKNFRRVCKSWWEVSLRRWRQNSTIIFRLLNIEHNSAQQFMMFWEQSRLLPDQSNLDLYPFKKYSLRYCSIDLENKWQSQFWNVFGNTMSHLEMRYCRFKSVTEFRRILFGVVSKLEVFHYNLNFKTPGLVQRIPWDGELMPGGINQNLREFRYTFNCYMELVVSLEEFFCHMPKIKSLVLNLTSRPPYFYPRLELLEILNAIQSAQAHGIHIQLQNLNLFEMGIFRSQRIQGHYNSLKQLNFPLTSLSIFSIEDFRDDSIILQTIIQLYSHTLRKLFLADFSLGINRAYPRSPFAVKFDALQDLGIVGYMVGTNLEFLEFTPKLKRLMIVDGIFEISIMLREDTSFLPFEHEMQSLKKWHWPTVQETEDVIFNTNFATLKPSPSLEEFVYLGKSHICTPLQVDNLTKLMPNLKTVLLGMTTSGFEIACEQWSNLQVLIIAPWAVEVEKSGFKKIMAELKYLRYFAMGRGRGKDWEPEWELNNESIENGLLKSQHLEKMRIICCDKVIRIIDI